MMETWARSSPDVGQICMVEVWARAGPDVGQIWPKHRPDVHYGGPAQLWPRPLLPDVGQMCIMEVRARSGLNPYCQTWAGCV